MSDDVLYCLEQCRGIVLGTLVVDLTIASLYKYSPSTSICARSHVRQTVTDYKRTGQIKSELLGSL